MWNDERGDNILDSGAPWYDVYETRTSAQWPCDSAECFGSWSFAGLVRLPEPRLDVSTSCVRGTARCCRNARRDR
jgi:hypothetical protein